MSENLSEVLRADGTGENLLEAPLLSFKKKETRKKRKEKNKIHKLFACRLQVFYGGEEASQLKVKGPYHAARTPHQHLLQECLCSSRYMHFHYRLSLLQEDTDFLQEGAIFYRKVQISTGRAACLQEALYFYRKLPVEAQNEPECVS